MRDLRAKVPRTGGNWVFAYAVFLVGDRKSRLELLSEGGSMLSKYNVSGYSKGLLSLEKR
jgi:hypothetical protein